MNFLSTICDNLLKFLSIAGAAFLLLESVSGCATPTQQRLEAPTLPVKAYSRDDTLSSVKPVTLSDSPESRTSSKNTSTPEIKVHDDYQFDSSSVE